MTAMDWDAPLTDEQRDALTDKLAQEVHKRGLHTPAILFLEMNKPLAFLTGSFVLIGSGFLIPFFGANNVQQFSKLVSTRDGIEHLIQRIEELAILPQKATDKT